MTRINNWSLVVDVIKNRLAGWQVKHLSMGGRLILIKSVLENLPIYYLSLYKAPKAVLESIEAIMRRFLWAGCSADKKINWVAWDVITTSKNMGGLGLSKLDVVNDALLLKWVWCFKSGGNCLWKKVVIGCHGLGRSWFSLPCTTSASGCWKQITKICGKEIGSGSNLDSFFEGIVGDGSSIRFWVDSWLIEGPLRLYYPNLYKLEQQKWVMVSERLKVVDGIKNMNWQWRSVPSSAAEVSELFDLMDNIYNFDWKGGKDKWRWKACSSGIFSVSSAKKLLTAEPSNISQVKMRWKVWVPMKVKIMVWRSIINRLPTKSELHKRGVVLQSNLCELCNMDVETNTHLFTGCLFSAEVWYRVEAWCRLNPLLIFDVADLMEITNSQPFTKEAKYIIRGIVFCTMWSIWIERNDRIFNSKWRRATEVVESIKMSSYCWFKHRSLLHY